MRNPDSKWIFHVMGICVLVIASLLTYMSYQTWHEYSTLSRIEESAERLSRGSQKLAYFKTLTIIMLIVCVVLLFLVFRISETYWGSARLYKLSHVVDGLREKSWDQRIKTNSKGAMAALETSLDKLREDLQSKDSGHESVISEHAETLNLWKTINQKLIKMATAVKSEDIFRYFGDILTLLKPSHKYYLLQCDLHAEVIASEPFITQHTNRELFFKKCGPLLMKTLAGMTVPFLWKDFIAGYTPQSDHDLGDLDYLSKIELAFGPVLIFPFTIAQHLHYLLVTDLDTQEEQDEELSTFIEELLRIFLVRMKQIEIVTRESDSRVAQVLNVHEFLSAARKSIKILDKSSQPLVFFMIGIDFFETILEIYGEHTTQQLLKQLVELIRGNSRNSDVVARFSDDVFLLMITDIEEANIPDTAEHYRKLIENHTFVHGDDQVRITVSVGSANIRHEFKENEEILLKRVRSMFDKAVRSGGNVSCFEGQLVERSG